MIENKRYAFIVYVAFTPKTVPTSYFYSSQLLCANKLLEI
jgi:hypothetical protein